MGAHVLLKLGIENRKDQTIHALNCWNMETDKAIKKTRRCIHVEMKKVPYGQKTITNIVRKLDL